MTFEDVDVEDIAAEVAIQVVEAPQVVTREDFRSVIDSLLDEGSEETAREVAETVGLDDPRLEN